MLNNNNKQIAGSGFWRKMIQLGFLSCGSKYYYCAFDIFQKVVFCLALYTEEVNLQTFAMI